MNPVCAFRRINLQIPREYFGAGKGVVFRGKALISLGTYSGWPWLDSRAEWVSCSFILDKGCVRDAAAGH
jgi:hypothetical protein